jgi:hypothetical protein
MNPDYIATLVELPPRHRGVILEQLQQAALSATFYMRAMGLALPGQDSVPTHAKVHAHLCKLTNSALQAYLQTLEVAVGRTQAAPPANEIWGEDGDDLFHICLSGRGKTEEDGYVVEIDFNLLYSNAAAV